ncbi:MAG: aldolase/citrate lyase family protein, partial [Gammaproteobacteria bacterium]|nr:aldolase/citrate lyase family protein [Gammaproteobacteria bacterium]
MMRRASFRERLRAREWLLGTFSKTPSFIVHEVLARSALDCVCIDAEHAPFDRPAIDQCVAALIAGDMPAIVRVPACDEAAILQALDTGATGVMVPHVSDPDIARAAVRAATYGASGSRGFAGSTRAARYGEATLQDHLERSNRERVVVAQVEDAAALAHLDELSAVDGIDCLFVGRADLTVSLGAATTDDPIVIDAVERICRAGAAAGRAVGMYCPRGEDL